MRIQLLLPVLLFLSCISPYENEPEQRPNFIVVITDDQRYDALGAIQDELNGQGRYPWIQTPNLDALARQGMLFKNAFVVNSLCSPSRASILTGNYGHKHGIRDNHTPYHGYSFASILRDHGYHSGYFGKWHMGNQLGKKSGFDHSFSFIGQGDYYDAWFENDGNMIKTKGWIDHVTTDHFLEYLQEHHDLPFCYIVGYKAPHGPFNNAPETVRKLYSKDQVQPVPNLFIEPGYEAPVHYSNKETYEAENGRQDRVALQYITAIDLCVGEIVSTLDDLEIRENTYILVMSDNGYYNGEHGLIDKRSAYEESIRIPMILAGPKIVPGKTEKMVLNIDVAPSILSLAGLNVDNQFHGKDFSELLWGDEVELRNEFYYEYNRLLIGPQYHIKALRTAEYKLIEYDGYDELTELYNLKEDPFETRNLARDMNHIQQLSDLRIRLQSHSRQLQSGSSYIENYP